MPNNDNQVISGKPVTMFPFSLFRNKEDEINLALDDQLGRDYQPLQSKEEEEQEGLISQRPKIITVVLDEIKALYTLAIPMILSGLLNYSKAAISMFFMAKLGKSALAGGSLAIGVANITGYSFISGLATGMDGIASQAFGARNGCLLSHTLQRTIISLLIFSMPIALLWFYFEPVLIFSGQNSSITSTAITYLRFSIPTLLFQSLIHPIKIYLRSQKITTPFTLSTAFSLAIHIPTNYIAVYCLDLGLKGIAFTVCLADFNVMITLLVYLFLSGHLTVNSLWFWRDCASFRHYEDWSPIFTLALPSCASVCLEWWWYEFMIVFSGLLVNAPEAVATMGILIQMTALIYQFPISLNQAVSTRVGNELGADRPKRALMASVVALACAIFTGIISMSFMIGMRNVWGRMFTSDPAIISLVASVLPVVGLCELGNCPQTTVCGVLRGCARPTSAAYINFGSFYGVGLPAALVLGFGFKFGLLGLWLGLLAAQMVCFGIMVVALLRTNWDEQADRAFMLICGYLGKEGNETRKEEPTSPAVFVN
ncbi:PREDICTED: MATE efflux family protein LAL5-like isoform X1 [Fragaria vesca subsp. vesca]|uniref:MATE efflux family protein LAL5-like isoform X1 n=2 Tax=Fragaria vesca subsp. vesca TaxID=101020 RepID=UPI0002C37858|nr:PREDICTED: MATE efflux family protein LAL5-like isoform X1 [Fragaria vesca subsp. vesca]